MTDVTKSTITNAIWQQFYDRLSDNVTQVSIASGTSQIKTYSGSFNSKMLDSKSNYPILIVDQPIYSEDYFTLGKTEATGTIDVEIYTNANESAMKFLDDIKDSIETYKTSLREAGIRMVDVEDISSDMVERGSLKIHMRRITFRWKFVYDKTKAW